MHQLVLPKKELCVFGEVPLISNQAIFLDKGLPGKQNDADEAEGRIVLAMQRRVYLFSFTFSLTPLIRLSVLKS